MKWKQVVLDGVKYPYQVSDAGQVRRILPERRVSAVETEPVYRMLKPLVSGGGYVFVILSRLGKELRIYIHRLVLTVFVGKCPPGFETNHINAIRDDNRLVNLEWLERHRNVRAKLDAEAVRAIRLMLKNGISQRKLAKMFGVSQPHLSLINTGRVWRNVRL